MTYKENPFKTVTKAPVKPEDPFEIGYRRYRNPTELSIDKTTELQAITRIFTTYTFERVRRARIGAISYEQGVKDIKRARKLMTKLIKLSQVEDPTP